MVKRPTGFLSASGTHQAISRRRAFSFIYRPIPASRVRFMAFTRTGISGVMVQSDGPELLISWNSSNPVGSAYQVYVDRRLTWSGVSTCCYAPIPAGPTGRSIWVEVGLVDAGEAYQNFSSELLSLSRASTAIHLSWTGGTYLDSTGQDDLQGFRIYCPSSPGTAVDFSTPVADITAYPGGWISDGFGLGGFGSGGFGRSATSYRWTSEPLQNGVWNVTIVPYDRSGTNRGAGQTVSVTITTPPRPPAVSANGSRLTYIYSAQNAQVTLNWSASPSL